MKLITIGLITKYRVIIILICIYTLDHKLQTSVKEVI